MKIILSRKGFDSGYGKVASPIVSGHRPVSLPIPLPQGVLAGGVSAFGKTLGQVLHDLTGGRLGDGETVHLDPDLDRKSLRRLPGWRPAFGQVAAAQRHLENQQVGVGDLFLFFGWFRQAAWKSGHLHYTEGAPDVHAFFGWLQVGQVIKVDEVGPKNVPAWLEAHPHVRHAADFSGQNNTIYVARGTLDLGGSTDSTIDGGGVFQTWTKGLQLTVPGQKNRSVWRVPTWLEPGPTRQPLTYHGKLERWTRSNGNLTLQSAAKGQEFVLDTQHYPEAATWARGIIEAHT